MRKKPNVSRKLLEKYLFVESDAEARDLLSRHPKLKPYGDVTVAMREAVTMMLIAVDRMTENLTDFAIIAVEEHSPGISVVLSQDPAGERTANLFEIPASVLRRILLRSPSDLHFILPLTLQTSLHHPEYLSKESYWLLDIWIHRDQADEDLHNKLALFQRAIAICLKGGLNSTWVLNIHKKYGHAAQ